MGYSPRKLIVFDKTLYFLNAIRKYQSWNLFRHKLLFNQSPCFVGDGDRHYS